MEGNTTTPQPAPSPVPLKSQDEAPYRSQQPPAPSAPLPQRDISSSIASNLASARGIPANRQRRGSPASPASSTQHAEGKLTTPQRRSKLSEYPSRAAPNPIQKIASTVKSPGAPKVIDQPSKLPFSTEEAFSRFYTTFENLYTKLSAPLAFAGLPLGLDETPTPQVTAATPSKTATISEKFEDDSEYNNAFSRAALRAIRDERGLAAPAESFYVVPSTGGTISYANMLTRTKREAARSLGMPEPSEGEHADDEFVDARETPQPPSPISNRKSGKVKGGGNIANNKTMEELVIQNHAMEEFIDRLCKRVQEFEISSQSQNIALHQSFRIMQSQALPPQLSGAGLSSGGEQNAANDERLAALEDQLKTAQKENERMGRENEKLKGVVGRYRERWEKLKEGARTRRDGTGTGTGGEG